MDLRPPFGSVQFKMVCTRPGRLHNYALHAVSEKLHECCLWHSSYVCLIWQWPCLILWRCCLLFLYASLLQAIDVLMSLALSPREVSVTFGLINLTWLDPNWSIARGMMWTVHVIIYNTSASQSELKHYFEQAIPTDDIQSAMPTHRSRHTQPQTTVVSFNTLPIGVVKFDTTHRSR